MARKVFLEDNEIKIIVNALRNVNINLLGEIKPKDSSYNKSSVIKDTVDEALCNNKKIINLLEDVFDGGMEDGFKMIKSRL